MNHTLHHYLCLKVYGTSQRNAKGMLCALLEKNWNQLFFCLF